MEEVALLERRGMIERWLSAFATLLALFTVILVATKWAVGKNLFQYVVVLILASILAAGAASVGVVYEWSMGATA